MSYISRPTVTRAANTTAYTAGDVVGGVINFKGFPAQADVLITSADLRIDIASIPSGMTSFRLHLYKERPASAYVDNDAWDLPSGDRDDYIGFVDIGTIDDLGSTLYVQNSDVRMQARTGLIGLFGYLVTVGAFTPASNSEVYRPCLRAYPLSGAA